MAGGVQRMGRQGEVNYSQGRTAEAAAAAAAAMQGGDGDGREEGDRNSSEGVASGSEEDAERANRRPRRAMAGAESSDAHDRQLRGGGNDSKRSQKRDMQLAGAAREAMDRCHAMR